MSFWQQLDDPMADLDMVRELLGIRGRVLPMSSVPPQIEADVLGLDLLAPDELCALAGQVTVARARATVQSVRLMPRNPPVHPETMAVVRQVDTIVLGPGSWLTSVTPHLLVPEPHDAILSTPARRTLVTNITATDETNGFTASRHIEPLVEHAPALHLDFVLADVGFVGSDRHLTRFAAPLGAELAVADVHCHGGGVRHGPRRLADACQEPLASRDPHHEGTGEMMAPMASIQRAKTGLAAVVIPHPNAHGAEMATILKSGGGLHLVGGRTVIKAELGSTATAQRLRTYIHDLYSLDSDLLMINTTGLRRATRHAVRVIRDGEALTRLTRLVGQRRHPVRGLSAVMVGGSIADSVVVWRGAFLVRGSLTEPGRSMTLEITCPGSEVALALSGATRRLGIIVKSCGSRGVDRVVLWGGEAIVDPLTRMDAQEIRLIQEERHIRCEVKAQVNRLANFDDVNLRCPARAAVIASARVERALEILGEDTPVHLVATGRLCIEHRQVSLGELGKLHDPPLTEDAVAGRIRRLLATTDKAVKTTGIPNMEVSLPADLNDSQ